ncbi:MAG: hypothetical protein AAGI24_15030 [Pseudomonadota bacterium]
MLVNGRTAALAVNSEASSKSANSTSVAWEAEIPLEVGNNKISISIVDALGNISEAIGSAELVYLPTPARYVFDPVYNQILGIGRQVAPNWELISYDLGTGGAQVITRQFPLRPTAYCYKPDMRSYIYASNTRNDAVTISAFDIDTKQFRSVGFLTLNSVVQDSTSAALGLKLACDTGDDSAYLKYSFYNPDDPAAPYTFITKTNLTSGKTERLAEFNTQVSEGILIDSMAIMGSALIVDPSGSSARRPLLSINTNSGNVTELPRSDIARISLNGPVRIATDPSTETIYLANDDAFFRYDVDSERFTWFSDNFSGAGDAFGDLGSLYADLARNRVITWDGNNSAFLGVDVDSGQRSELLAIRRGSGGRIVAPIELSATSDQLKLFALDAGSTTLPARLISIDTATGNRQHISDFSVLPASDAPNSLDIDEQEELAYVSFPDRILEVSLKTGRQSLITDSDFGFGSTFGNAVGVVLDKPNNRLIYADNEKHAIMQVALDVKLRSPLSSAEGLGDGEPFVEITSLALDIENNRLFAADQGLGAVFSVDLTTGDRTMLADTCLTNGGFDVLNPGDLLNKVIIAGEKLILNTALMAEVDLRSGVCTTNQSYLVDLQRPRDIVPIGHDVFLFILPGAVGLLDTETREVTYISN